MVTKMVTNQMLKKCKQIKRLQKCLQKCLQTKCWKNFTFFLGEIKGEIKGEKLNVEKMFPYRRGTKKGTKRRTFQMLKNCYQI